MNKQAVLNRIRSEALIFTFEKANGDMSLMVGTTAKMILDNAIKEGHIKESTGEKKEPDYTNSFPVFSVDRGAWRSIRWDRLKTVNGQEFNNE